MISEAYFLCQNGGFSIARWRGSLRHVQRKSCETVGELRISLISFVTVCYLALRSER